MKKTWLIIFFSIIGLSLFWSLASFSGWAEIFSDLRHMPYWGWLTVIGLNIGILCFGALRWKLILKSYDIKISYRHLLEAYFGSYAIGFFAPVMGLWGEIAKAYTVETRIQRPREEIIPSILIEKSFILLLNICIILGAIMYYFWLDGKEGIFYILLGFLVCSFAIMRFSRKYKLLHKEIKIQVNPEKHKVAFSVVDRFNNFVEFLKNNKHVKRFAFIACLEASCSLAQTWAVVYLLTGSAITLGQTIFLQGFSYISMMALIPGALGSMEVSQIFALGSLGFSPGIAVAFSIVLRVSELTLACVGVYVYAKLGVKALINYLFSEQ
jgi:uncharacterized protein (TIRG00374 family)